MPVRSLSSPVLRWPDAVQVRRALDRWAQALVKVRRDVVRLGFFGSYARGDWGVGSDLDIIAVIESSNRPFEKRTVDWDLSPLPVPADLLVYTRDEWNSLKKEGRFYRALAAEAVWLYVKDS